MRRFIALACCLCTAAHASDLATGDKSLDDAMLICASHAERSSLTLDGTGISWIFSAPWKEPCDKIAQKWSDAIAVQETANLAKVEAYAKSLQP